MKRICNISIDIKKILVMLLLVVSLAACGNDNTTIVNNKDCTTNQDTGVIQTCVESCGGSNSCKESCMECEMFNIIYDAVGTSIMRIHGELTQGSMSVMMICFAVWLAKRLLTFVSSVTESSIAQVWNDISKQAFLCLFCGILASSSTMLVYAVNTFVYPIYVSFLKLGVDILKASVGDSGGNLCEFNASGIITQAGFPYQFRDVMVCMILTIKAHLAQGGDTALSMMKQSSSFIGGVVGFLVYLSFWVVRVSFVFYLVDSIFQMGIIILLLPMYIMFYAFKVTRGWCSSAFKSMLSSAGFLMCFSVVIYMIIGAMSTLIASVGASKTDFQNVSVGVLSLILIGFLIQSSLNIAQDILKAMVQASISTNFQKTLKSAGEKALKLTVSAINALITGTSSAMPEGVINVVNAVKTAKEKADRIIGGNIKKK